MSVTGTLKRSVITLVVSLPLAPVARAASANYRIEPGRSIGGLKIGEDDQRSAKQLGKAGAGDAAMGHAWATWFSKDHRNQVDVHSGLAEGNAAGRTVRIIRVTSPAFKSRSGIGPGRTFADIRRAFPALKRISAYVPAPDVPRTYLYDDANHGIAFEFRPGPTGKCVAISVHKPGKNPDTEYLTMTAYLREVAMGQASTR